MTPYSHLEVVELSSVTRYFADANGERTRRETLWAVYDNESVEDEGWFALVERAQGYRDRQLTCWCSDGREETGSECVHERAVVEFIGPKPEAVGISGERTYETSAAMWE